MKNVIFKFSTYGFLKNLRFFEPFFYLYFLSKGFSYTKIGILISIREMTSYIFEIPSGIFSDYYSPKKSLILCFALYICSFFTIHSSQNIFYISIIGMFLFGIAEAFRSGTHKAIIINYLEEQGMLEKKHEIYGYTRSWALLGSALSAIISGFLVFYTGNYNNLFIASTIPYLMLIFLISTYPNEKNNHKKKISFKEHTFSLLKELKNINLIKGILNTSIFEADFKFTKDLIQPIIKASIAVVFINQLTINKYTGAILGCIYFFIYLISCYFARNSHKILSKINTNEENIINLSLSIFAVFTFICGITLYFNHSHIIPVILLLLNFCLFNIRKPLGISIIASMTAKTHRASVLSIESQLKTLFLSFFAVISGILIDNYGLSFAFFFISITILLISPFIYIKKRP
ncbi:MAG: MFS transporter [Candidatus Muirbacterium halophilum]|nr:MFS transporter [Candidatus Muirbacterium halophilum]MCK9476464.1 MFS transporter [Candidatus Muirbacterium halophilum]